jgi:DNA-binding SARP family transcriptional activator
VAHLALYLFGPPRVERDGQPVTTDTRKAIALLAYLAVTRQRHGRDVLATLLWPEYDQTHARATLRRTLSALNKALAGPWLRIERETISLNWQQDFWLDVDEFRMRLEQSRNHQHPSSVFCNACLEALKQAAALYTADFMAGFGLQDSESFDDWQFYQADGLRHEQAGLLERLVQSYSARGEFETAILHARRLLTLDPLHEPAHRYLIQLYAWAGQRSASIHQYQECVKILDRELGVAPLEATTHLYEAIRENRVPPPPEIHSEQILEKAVRNDATHLRFTAAGGEEAHDPVSVTDPVPDTPSASIYPLVGRQQEWKLLQNLYQERLAGYIVALGGEAGIGKTRLAEEFLVVARAKGARVVAVRCYEGEVELAYVPIAAALRIAIRQQHERWWEQIPPHWLSEAARLLPELLDLRSDLPVPPPLDSVGGQSRFFEGLLQLCFALTASSVNPGIIFFDDLHWADDASLEFLAYLARRLQEQPLCLLLTWRNVQRAPLQRLQRLLAEAQHQKRATLLKLSRLDQPTIEQLVQQATPHGSTAHVRNLTHRLYQETEGVPLFLTEYLSAIASGFIAPDDHDWDLPHGVRDVLISRLTMLEETSRQLLGTAATIGRSFDFETLREASGRSEEETITGLEELINQGLVQEMRANGGIPAYDFNHEKMRGLVYDEMTLARRRLLHRRVAEALIAHRRGQPEASALAGQVARHYLASGNTEAAAQYSLQAGEYARSLYAHTEALAHFRQALTLGHLRAAYLQEIIGDLHTFLGEYESALKCYQLALTLSTDLQSRAMLEQKQGKVYERRGRWELAEDHYATALHLLDQQGGPIEAQARIYADWSLAAHHHGSASRALELAQLARELAEATGDTRALAQVHNLLGILASSQGSIETAYTHLERSLTLAELLQDASIHAAALNNLALVCKARGAIERAIALTDAALALCASQGDRHREAALHSNLADLYHAAGRTTDAMDQLKLSARIYNEIDVEAGTIQPDIWKLVEW